jgi:4-hydroxybenzoate polyprenyltransferase
MKIILLLLPCLVISFLHKPRPITPLIRVNEKLEKHDLVLQNHSNDTNSKIHFENPTNKITPFLQLIRYQSILPTTVLSFSGGWIMNPSITPRFLISIVITLLVLSSSMIMNDLYDIHIDRINSPNRPLVTGKITIPEAIAATVALIGTAELCNMKIMPANMQYITHGAIALILLYTPVLKKIPLVKNLACAALVSFSPFFSGLAAISATELISQNRNYNILLIALNTIFLGSLSNEILLDIKDRKGDKENGIYTIPVITNKPVALTIAASFTAYNLFSNSLSLAYLYNNLSFGCIYGFILSPLFINLWKIYRNRYSRESITQYMKMTNYPLIAILFYLCLLANRT